MISCKQNTNLNPNNYLNPLFGIAAHSYMLNTTTFVPFFTLDHFQCYLFSLPFLFIQNELNMTDILSLPFEYKQRTYTALIAVKKDKDHKEYRVTITNGELEKLLFGHHIIIEKEVAASSSLISPFFNRAFASRLISSLVTAFCSAMLNRCSLNSKSV